jgi:hypothetical protein
MIKMSERRLEGAAPIRDALTIKPDSRALAFQLEESERVGFPRELVEEALAKAGESMLARARELESAIDKWMMDQKIRR